MPKTPSRRSGSQRSRRLSEPERSRSRSRSRSPLPLRRLRSLPRTQQSPTTLAHSSDLDATVEEDSTAPHPALHDEDEEPLLTVSDYVEPDDAPWESPLHEIVDASAYYPSTPEYIPEPADQGQPSESSTRTAMVQSDAAPAGGVGGDALHSVDADAVSLCAHEAKAERGDAPHRGAADVASMQARIAQMERMIARLTATTKDMDSTCPTTTTSSQRMPVTRRPPLPSAFPPPDWQRYASAPVIVPVDTVTPLTPEMVNTDNLTRASTIRSWLQKVNVGVNAGRHYSANELYDGVTLRIITDVWWSHCFAQEPFRKWYNDIRSAKYPDIPEMPPAPEHWLDLGPAFVVDFIEFYWADLMPPLVDREKAIPQRFGAVRLRGWNAQSMTSVTSFLRELGELLATTEPIRRADANIDRQCIKSLIRGFQTDRGYQVSLWQRLDAIKERVTWDELIGVIHTTASEFVRIAQAHYRLNIRLHHSERETNPGDSHARATTDSSRDRKRDRVEPSPTTAPPKKRERVNPFPVCDGCGHQHPPPKEKCRNQGLPGWNRTDLPWGESPSGKELLATKGLKMLPLNKEKQQPSHGKKENRGNGEIVAVASSYSTVDTWPMRVLFPNRKEINLPVKLDTGATSKNYIHPNIAVLARDNGCILCDCSTCKCSVVCTVIDKYPCVKTTGTLELTFIFNEADAQVTSNQFHGKTNDYNEKRISLSFEILPNSVYAVIIGMPAIRCHDLTRLCRRYFTEEVPSPHNEHLSGERLADLRTDPSYPNASVCGAMVPAASPVFFTQQRNEDAMVRVHVDELLHLAEGVSMEDNILWREDILSVLDVPQGNRGSERTVPAKPGRATTHPRGAFDRARPVRSTPVSPEPADESMLELPQIVGDLPVHAAARDLVRKHWRVFRRTVKLDPADVQPMELRLVEESKWKSHANRLAPRVQSIAKEDALRDMITTLLSTGIISESQATHYSQVLLVSKPGSPGKWRLCIDYRSLNESLEGMGWPIPRIEHILQRIGRRKAKWFAVLDLTSGYHQVLLSKNSRELAAFITPFGIYVPNRISMGLKSAPAYFQQQLQSDVLAGLMYVICELYIDDIIAYGHDEESFLKSLEAVLTRLEERNITLNPDKAKIAVCEVEAVGHVIDQYGIKMSTEKIQKVMDFPLPKMGKQLKQFLGLANYFRSHIQNFSVLARPLDQLIRNYNESKHRVIRWDTTTTENFRKLQIAIGECPKLYFLNPNAPIYVETDASDYAIGAYLYQIIDGIKQPVAFMSRSLTGSQINWSTIEKECYAIYSALKDWEYLLRDVKFVVRTDHKNLRFLNTNVPKVVRWKLAVQEFNFSVEYVPGPENVVADALSRIVREDCQAKDPTSAKDDAIVKEEEDNEFCDPDIDREIIAALREVHSTPIQPDFEQALINRQPLRPPRHHTVNTSSREIVDQIASVHNSLRGHHGVDRCMEILQRECGCWPQMRQHIRKFIDNCPLCQKLRDIKPIIVSAPYTAATYAPMVRVNMDTIGPLPRDDDNNEYILVLIDCFSRFVELYAIPSTEARTCAKCLIDFVGRYGAPECLLSDRGSQFVNATIDEMSRLFGATRLLSLAYSKQENAIVERANKEVMRHLRGMVYDTRLKKEWSIVLPLVQRILNSSTHSSIGISPAQLIFGNAIQLDRGLVFHGRKKTNGEGEDTNDHLTPSVKQYVDRLLSHQSVVIKVAQQYQYQRDTSALQEARKRGQPTEFPVNSFVLLRYPAGLGGDHRPPTKLHTKWQGPLKVVSSRGEEYTLQNLVTLKNSQHHVQELAPFHWDAAIVDPSEVAWHDYDAFEIDHIVSHRGNLFRVSTLEFRVRWKGFNDSEDTWEPWKQLRTTQALHAYLRLINQERLIPKGYRNTNPA